MEKIHNVSLKEVVQLSISNEYMKTWYSIEEVEPELGVNSYSISRVCRGIRSSTGGFKWMYKEDYEKYIKEQELITK